MNDLDFDVVKVNVILVHVIHADKHRDGSVNHMNVEFKLYDAHWKSDGDHSEG